jgi:hypothetical protein
MNEIEQIKNIIINEINLMINDEFPQHMMDAVIRDIIKTSTKLYKFDKNKVNELKNLANLS